MNLGFSFILSILAFNFYFVGTIELILSFIHSKSHILLILNKP